MIIEEKLVSEYNLTEDVISYLHSKTKLQKREIRSVHFSNHWPGGYLTIRIIHESGRQMSLDFPISKIMQTSRMLKLEELGI